MANGFTNFTIVGNLTKDPELNMTGTGRAYCRMVVAVNTSYKQGDTWKEKADFLDLTCWAKTAEHVAKYLLKGDLVMCIGKISTWRKDADSYPQVQLTADLVYGPKEASKRTPGDGAGDFSDLGNDGFPDEF